MLSGISDLYLASYHPSSFYITSKSIQGEWLVKRIGSKYVLLSTSGVSPTPWLPVPRMAKLKINEIVSVLRHPDVKLESLTGEPSFDSDTMGLIISHPNSSLHSLRQKLEEDLESIRINITNLLFNSSSLSINSKLHKSSKKYVKVQGLRMTFTIEDIVSNTLCYIDYQIEVLPFKENGLQIKFRSPVVNSKLVKIQRDLHEKLTKEIATKGYSIS